MLSNTALFSLLAAASGALASHGASNHAALAKRVESSLTKRETYSGRTTWYPTDTGPDACTGKNHQDSDWYIAMNMPQSQSCCGKKVHISHGGKSTVATCVDFCASCPQVGQIDLTKDLFKFFMGGLDAGEFTSSWYFVGDDEGGDDNNNNGGGDKGNDDDDDDKEEEKPKPTTTKKPKTTSTPKPKPTTTSTKKKTTTTSPKPTSSSAKPSSSSVVVKTSSSSSPAAIPTSTTETAAPTEAVGNVGSGPGSAAGGDSDAETTEDTPDIAGALSGTADSAAPASALANRFAAAGAVMALLAYHAL